MNSVLSNSRVPLLVALALGLTILLAALVAPIATLDQIFLDPDTYSIVGSLVNLWSREDYLLLFLIAAFSVVFPVIKYLMLIRIVLKNRQDDDARTNLGLLRFLGKWSMLDVFVTVISFGAANLGILSQVQIHWGIYLYAAGVIVSMSVAMLMSWQAFGSQAMKHRVVQRSGGLSNSIFLLAFASFAVGLALPLIEIEKWLFWQSSYSLLSALRHLLANGEYLLPAILLVFVIALPLARFFVLLQLRLRGASSSGLEKAHGFLEEWAMFDVYMLAMLLVVVKLSDSASVSLQPGFWLLGLAAALSLAESVSSHLQRKATA